MGSKKRMPSTKYFFILYFFCHSQNGPVRLQKYRVKGVWAMFWVLILKILEIKKPSQRGFFKFLKQI